VVWVVGDSTKDGSESGTSFRQALHFKDIGFNLHDTMIYMKDNPPPTGGPTRYYQSFEYCFILSKGTPKTFNPIVEPRRNKHNDKRTVRTRAITRNRAGTFTQKEIPINTGNVKLQNVWNYTVGGGSVASDMIAHEHPAIFPEALVRDHIVSWSNEGDVIYDPFMGSGTVAIVAISLNRQYFGSEISTEYVEIAQRRISNHRQSLETFNIIDHILR
jgi:site-specific DNA-methyltransferase (adenine-specific)